MHDNCDSDDAEDAGLAKQTTRLKRVAQYLINQNNDLKKSKKHDLGPDQEEG